MENTLESKLNKPSTNKSRFVSAGVLFGLAGAAAATALGYHQLVSQANNMAHAINSLQEYIATTGHSLPEYSTFLEQGRSPGEYIIQLLLSPEVWVDYGKLELQYLADHAQTALRVYAAKGAALGVALNSAVHYVENRFNLGPKNR